jgi:hypothetical protein
MVMIDDKFMVPRYLKIQKIVFIVTIFGKTPSFLSLLVLHCFRLPNVQAKLNLAAYT